MHKTAWTKKASSVPSDRIKPVQPQSSTASSKGKGKQQPSEPPKSKEVRRLETLHRALRESSGAERDPKGGCFCQAREHTTSSYSPLCTTCGLVLCSINLPQYSCPHCAIPIVTATIRASLVVQLESQISETNAREIQDRERSLAEARQAAGAFPTLASPTGKLAALSPPVSNTNQTHKVLSLNSKTKKVIVSSYTTTPVSSRPASRAESEEEEPIRVPPPPTEVVYSTKRVDRSRPWENLGDGSLKYVPLARVDAQGGSKDLGKQGRKRKGKGKEN